MAEIDPRLQAGDIWFHEPYVA